MTVNRRGFLAAGGALAAAAFAPGRLLAALEGRPRAARTPAPDLSNWAAVRALFPLAPGWTHLSAFFLVSHPRPVREAIERYRRALDENPLLCVEHSLFDPERASVEVEVRRSAGEYCGGGPDNVALVPNTTHGLALVHAGLSLRAGDEILLTTHDHFVHHEAARLAAERAGATTRRITLYDRAAEADRAEIVDRVRRAIRPSTRVLGITWVHSCTGVRLPVRAIADVVEEANRGRADARRLVLVVDGVHGFGCSDEPVAGLGADFFCAGTHKWIFAPRGTGILFARADRWRLVRPVVPNFSDLESYGSILAQRPLPPVNAAQMTPGGFHAFEHQWGMRAAFELHRAIGPSRVAARIRELNARCRAGLAAIPGVTVHTPSDPALSAGIQCFEIRGLAPEAAAAKLVERRVVASSSPYAVSYVRLAPSLVNDERDVDRALEAVAALARG